MNHPSKEFRTNIISVFVIASAASLLLGGYEFARSPSATLFRQFYGKQNLALIMAMVPVGVLAIIYLYGKLLSRFGPRRTLLFTTLGSGAVLVGCHLAIRADFAPASGFLYIFREGYIVLIIEQYWSFINSTLKTTGAKWLNGMITGVASIGAFFGGKLVGVYATDLGTLNLLLVAAAICVPAAILSDVAIRIGGEPTPAPKDAAHAADDTLGVSMFMRFPILRFLFGVVLITQTLGTVLDLNFQEALYSSIPSLDEQTAYMGNLYGNINGISFILQFVVVTLALRFLPVFWIHVSIPFVHLIACATLLAMPSLGVAAMSLLLFKSIDYSVFRASKELLYIPLPFAARYRAKEVIDVFGYRFGKGGSSLIITGFQRSGFLMTGAYAWIAVAGCACWIALVVKMKGTYKASGET